MAGAATAGVWGWTDRPGTVAHWPGGIVVAFPRAGSVNGTLVLDAGDVNLTFKRYLERPVRLELPDDHIISIAGEGTDAELMRRYLAAWGDRAAYAVSHVGWGLNPRARYEALAMYDQRDTNGTELRAFAGNFLFSTGANEFAGRFTEGHFDIPVRNCTIALDGVPVVVEGKLSYACHATRRIVCCCTASAAASWGAGPAGARPVPGCWTGPLPGFAGTPRRPRPASPPGPGCCADRLWTPTASRASTSSAIRSAACWRSTSRCASRSASAAWCSMPPPPAFGGRDPSLRRPPSWPSAWRRSMPGRTWRRWPTASIRPMLRPGTPRRPWRTWRWPHGGGARGRLPRRRPRLTTFNRRDDLGHLAAPTLLIAGEARPAGAAEDHAADAATRSATPAWRCCRAAATWRI